MLRRTAASRWNQAPTVYPFRKPFYDTPYDQDRHQKNLMTLRTKKASYPAWMDHGYDGTGESIGLYRHHPLSKSLVGSLQRDHESVGRVFKSIIQGFHHKNGRTLYSGGKLPNPSRHPYLTGEPCPVYGWRVIDHSIVRQFDAPQVSAEKARYKPYVALHERKIIGEETVVKKETPPETDNKKKEAKPLLKRLFFWQ